MDDDDSHLNGLEPDIYGQVHPKENDDFVSKKMKSFEAQIEAASKDDKKYLLMAQEKCPEILTKEFQLMFLRCEMFRVKLAVDRYMYYWKKRVEVFGEEKAFLPLTLEGALKDDTETVRRGVYSLLSSTDEMGRAFLLFDPSLQDKTKYSRESMVRSFWYVIHSALERETAQQHGVVGLGYPHNAKLHQFDRQLNKVNIASLKGAIPLRMSAIHICQPPSFISIVLPIVKLFMGERMRKRINVHTGDIDKVQASLAKYGITPDMLPTDLNGHVQVDREKWAEQRLKEKK